MKDIEIKITRATRYVDIEKETEKVGNEGENLQTNLVFSFTDTFVNGQARLEYTINGEEGTIALIGPKRMEYERVITLLNYIMDNISNK